MEFVYQLRLIKVIFVYILKHDLLTKLKRIIYLFIYKFLYINSFQIATMSVVYSFLFFGVFCCGHTCLIFFVLLILNCFTNLILLQCFILYICDHDSFEGMKAYTNIFSSNMQVYFRQILDICIENVLEQTYVFFQCNF